MDLITHIGGDVGAAHAEPGEGVPEGVAEGESVSSAEARVGVAHRRPPLVRRHARHEEERQRSEDVRGRQRGPQLRRKGVQERVRRKEVAARPRPRRRRPVSAGRSGLLQMQNQCKTRIYTRTRKRCISPVP